MASDPADQIILAIDTSNGDTALGLLAMASKVGATTVKFGLEIATAKDWRWCSEAAYSYGLYWVADAKLHDIPNTVVGAVKNLAGLNHPPKAITMHATSGVEAMALAQKAAGDIKMLAVTVLTSITEEETQWIYNPRPDRWVSIGKDMTAREVKVLELARDAMRADVAGVVCSGREVEMIKRLSRPVWAMVPGTRSLGSDVNDQHNVVTPRVAINAGADALVIGRQVTAAEDPEKAMALLIEEIAR